MLVGTAVQLVAASSQFKRLVQRLFDAWEQALAGRERGLRISQFSANALLLALEQPERDGIGVVGLQQLLPFALQLGDAPLLTSCFPFVLSLLMTQLSADDRFQSGRFLGGEPHLSVELDNLVGDDVDR